MDLVVVPVRSLVDVGDGEGCVLDREDDAGVVVSAGASAEIVASGLDGQAELLNYFGRVRGYRGDGCLEVVDAASEANEWVAG